MISVSQRWERLNGDSTLTDIRSLNDYIGRMTFPRMSNATFNARTEFGSLLSEDNYDSTLRRNLLDAANGITAMLFPVGDQGFSLAKPVRAPGGDDAKKFYAECTEQLVFELRSNSNFLNTSGEATLEWWTFGTGGMYREWSDRKQRLHFRNLPVNTYVMSQNPEGDIDEVYWRLSYTARDAAKEWGKEALPELVRDKVADESDKSEEEYVLGVFEVQDFDPPEIKKAAKGRRWLMMVEHKQTKTVVSKVGFHDNPFSFGRWATITGSPWGFAPTWLIIPEIKRLYRMQELADKLGLAALAPPIVALAKYRGMIERGPLGVNYVDDMSEAHQILQNATAEYKIALDRIQDAKDDIGAVLYQDFFRLFSSMDTLPETATVARLLDAERAAQIGTPYQRYTADFFAPQVTGAFKALYRQGKMPKPPSSMVVGTDETTGQEDVPLPAVLFENRLVNALKAVENIAFAEWMNTVGSTLAQASPEDFKAQYNWPEIGRGSFRTAIKREDYLNSKFESEKIKEEMAAAATRQAQINQMEQMA